MSGLDLDALRVRAEALKLPNPNLIFRDGNAEYAAPGTAAFILEAAYLVRALLDALAEAQRERDEEHERNRRWLFEDEQRAEAAEARLAEYEAVLRQALDCKGSFNGTVSERGGAPAICTKCEADVRALLAASGRAEEQQ